ncbi:hypothetical protein Tco_0937334 [Tanacetum coccineum]|uniref:Uncharacterized protein n=1 Tax=Tanacetum coccineum TaxID=301880 RepID=A0ABQ5DK49_9ASTR
MLGATRVQMSEDDLYNMHWTREEDGELETLDPQFLLGFELLEILDSTILDLLLDLTFFVALGTTAVEVILVKGHLVPSTVKVLPVVASGWSRDPIVPCIAFRL